MSDIKYTVTFKIVKPGARYYNDSNEIEHSIAGHIWYVLERSDSNDVKSYGFQSATGKSSIGEGFISTLDDENYFAQD
ncbi:TPA: hypothetical protein QB435_002073, partial [Pasteurella multocida]|nr:hypothetical protein [Pasteurella multocida]